MIAHSQEIHAVPQKNGTYNTTDGKPVAAEIAEVNEYSLSQLVNETDNDTVSLKIFCCYIYIYIAIVIVYIL